MKYRTSGSLPAASWGVATALLLLSSFASLRSASASNSFEESAYLWTQAYDTDLTGSAGQGEGDWLAYKRWLGVSCLGAESDPGWGPGDWYDCCQHVNWNAPWAKQQIRYAGTLPDILLGIGQMPWDPNTKDSWDQKMAWENTTWKAEAANDPTIMGYFANYAREVDLLGFRSVIIRLGYEFDGFWNPFGNLDKMSDMPANYIASWRNIVTAMRAADTKHAIKGFLWNPTDGDDHDPFIYYPGDAYVDFIGFDEYDFVYNGDYKVGLTQPTQAEQDAAWRDVERPRIDRFADFSRRHGNKPIIIGEWGLWQLGDKSHPSGGDNPSYIRRMYDWMSDPVNHVYMEVYFEAPSDGVSTLWTVGKNSAWPHATTFPKAAGLYRTLFGDLHGGG